MDLTKKPPTLKDLDIPSVHEFTQRYKEYKENITRSNTSRRGVNRLELLLEYQCLTNKVKYVVERKANVDPEESMEEKNQKIVHFLEDRLTGSSQDERRSRLKKGLENLKMDMKMSSSDARVWALLGEITDLLKNLGFDYESLRTNRDDYGRIVKDLIKANVFSPIQLEKAVALRMEGNNDKMDEDELESVLCENARILQQSWILNKSVEKEIHRKATREKVKFVGKQTTPSKVTTNSNQSKFRGACYRCNSKDHNLYDCPKVSGKEEVERILKEKRKSFKANSNKRKQFSSYPELHNEEIPNKRNKDTQSVGMQTESGQVNSEEVWEIPRDKVTHGPVNSADKVISKDDSHGETPQVVSNGNMGSGEVLSVNIPLSLGTQDKDDGNQVGAEEIEKQSDKNVSDKVSHSLERQGDAIYNALIGRVSSKQKRDGNYSKGIIVEEESNRFQSADEYRGIVDGAIKLGTEEENDEKNVISEVEHEVVQKVEGPGKREAFIGESGENSSDQTIDIRFENRITLSCLMDSGATHSILPSKVLKKLKLDASQIAPAFNDTFVTLGDGSTRIECTGVATCCLDFEIYVPTTWRKVEFLVVDIDSDQPILGAQELRSLGIDPKSALMRVIKYSREESKSEEACFADEVEDLNYQDIIEIGQTTDEELQAELDRMIQRSKDEGLPRELWTDMEQLVSEYKNVFRIKMLPNDGPALVTPMDVHFKHDAKQVRQSNRRYTEEELNAMKGLIDNLIEAKCIRRNHHAKWASPVMMVAKPKGKGSKKEFRMVCDLKIPNSQIHQTHWPMPHFETIMRKLRKSKYYALLDAFKGYWQFPVTPRCGELYSLKTPFGVFTPSRIVQGSTDAVKYFQAGMEEALGSGEFEDFLLWVDDVLSHAETPEELLKALRRIFQRCKERNIKLSVKKCNLFLTKVVWCGRMISEKGISFDPEYLQGLKDMHPPVTMADLQQWVCSMNWIRTTIPNFSKEMEIMQKAYRDCVSQVGSAKSLVLKRRKLKDYPEIWGKEQVGSFESTKTLMSNSIRLSHIDPEKILCIFPDASQYHWGLLVTQIPEVDVGKRFEQQRHEPLLCQSGSFKGSSLRWHIREKEAFPIVNAMMKLRYMLKRSDGFRLFTDHRNLVFVFDKEDRVNAGHTFKHADDRLSRWSLLFMGYRYSVEHIPGEENVVADLLSRWGANNRAVTLRSFKMHPGLVQVLNHPSFEWPTLAEIARFHSEIDIGVIPKGFSLKPCKDNDGNDILLYKNENGQILIMNQGLRDRICIIAHAGFAGHRKISVTKNAIKKKFFWPKLGPNVETFCKSCLHCRVDGPEMIPRPMGEAVHGSKPNEVLHYDFMHIGKSHAYDGRIYTYLLVLKDDFSSYIDLYLCTAADSAHAVRALMDWHSRFGVPEIYVSDQGSHFKNEVVAELCRLTHTTHHFTHAYTPRANGTVERVNRELRRLIRVWNSEFRLRLDSWPDLVPMMRHLLNFTENPRTGLSPAVIFGGLTSKHTLDTIFVEKTKEFRQPSVNRDDFLKTCSDLQVYLGEIHKRVLRTRRGDNAKYDPKRSVRANFHVGDFVMVSVKGTGRNLRSKPKWTGPYRVVRVISEWSFEVQHLVTEAVSIVHSTRLSFYCDKYLEVSSELKEQITFDESSGPIFYTIAEILNHRFDDGIKLEISWEGYERSDATWEPLETIYTDAPQVVDDYVRNVANLADRRKLTEALSNFTQ